MAAVGMAVNSGARLWGQFKALYSTIDTAVYKRRPNSVHDLELALRKHKPDFISLLKTLAKNALHREAVKKSTTEGIPIQGEQRSQTFSQQFIAETLILSDLFDLNELAAMELLMAGENQLPNYPGLTRGLVAVILYYDGQRSLVNSLRTLLQSREGRTWTLGMPSDVAHLIQTFTTQLVEEGLVNKILDLIRTKDEVTEMDKLQKERALGPPKHRKQVVDLYREIKLSLAECLFCLACQAPLGKADTLRLIAHLKGDNSLGADEKLEPVSLCLLLTLLYCFDVRILEQEDAAEIIQTLPVISDPSYLVEIHREMLSDSQWAVPGLKATAQFAWAMLLRQLSQYPLASGTADVVEDDEIIMDQAIEGNVFNFLRSSVVSLPEFHQDEFYCRRIHCLLTDLIYHMPLKVKELRNKGDETARIIMAHQIEGLEAPPQRRDLEHMFGLITELYSKDPLNLELCLEYWCPAESAAQESFYNYRPPPRQVALFKFLRGAGDLLPAPLYVPYVKMLTGLAAGPQAAQHCFNLLKTNGTNSGGSGSMVSWDHIFTSFNQYYSSLRRETQSSVDSNMYRAPPVRGITPQELEGILTVLQLTRCIVDQNENCRSAVFENQSWGAVIMLFGLVGCSIPSLMKAEILKVLAALAKTPSIAANIWQTLEVAQILPTTASSMEERGGIQIELEEIESRSEEYPMTIAFLKLLDRLTDIPIPAGLGAGYRAPGFDPYLEFIINSVFLRFSSRAYKDSAEKWEVSACALQLLCKLLQDHEIEEEDFRETLVDVQGGGIVPANKSPGHTLLLHMLNDSALFKMVLKVLDESMSLFEQYSTIPGRANLEKTSLLCLKMIETALEKETLFEAMVRDTGTSVLIATMDKLLLSINPRSGRADHMVNIAKFVTLNSFLPNQCLSAVRILYLVCQSAPIQADLVSLFTADEKESLQLLQGFVECIETDDREVKLDERGENTDDSEEDVTMAQVRNASRQHVIQLLLHAMDQPAPNLAHWMLGFEVRKLVAKTNLQDPGILGSPRTCLHSILAFLSQGIGTRTGPVCLMEAPKLAELCYNLVYVLCSNRDTSMPTLRYLRTTHNFLFNQLQHLPFKEEDYGHSVVAQQSWLLKTVAIELRITSLNSQRSHTERLLQLLLSDRDYEQTYVMQPVGSEEGDFTWDRDQTSFLAGASQTRSQIVQAQQTRRKLLCILDSISFAQQYPTSLQLDFFDPKLIEQVIVSCESKSKTGVVICDVRNLRRILINELNNQQGTLMAGQRPLIQTEIQTILATVVARNSVRESLYTKRQSFEAWRQVTEVVLAACPEDVLTGEVRQMIIFEVLQDLLVKVADDDAMPESTAPVAGVILTLMSNLRQCFLQNTMHSSSSTRSNMSQYVSMLDRSALPPEGSTVGSRTLFASSLQMVLKGLLDYIIRSGGGAGRVRANLYGALLYYLQIAQKPTAVPHPKGKDGDKMSRVLGTTDSEYEQLSKENLSTILSYGENLMETVCRDACDGHDIGRMLGLSVLDTVVSIDHYRQWLSFLSNKGYLQHLVDSILGDDAELQKVLVANPEQLRALYIYQSKMSLLTRVGETIEGAHRLLRCGLLQTLASCAFFDLRPEAESPEKELMEDMSGDEFIPSQMARYRILLFAALKLCLALLTSLGLENKDVAAQVMLFIISHSDVFNTILRSRKPLLSLSTLRELALTTCVIARANYHTELGSEYLDSETALIEFRGHRSRIQRQMMSLLSHYSFSPKFIKQINNLGNQTGQGSQDIGARVALAYQQVTANIVAYCRSLLTESGATSQFSRILFCPGLEEGGARDLQDTDDLSISSIGLGTQTPNLGVIVYLLKQCTSHFLVGYDSHRRHVQKLAQIQDLSSEDLKQFSGTSGTEKMSSQQRQELARTRLTQIVSHKAKELQHYAYVIENCLFIIWRHLEYYLLHCIPINQQPLSYQSHIRKQNQIRRLQDLTGIQGQAPAEPDIIKPEFEQLSHGVTRDDLDLLKQMAPSIIADSLLKKVQEINQCYVKDRSHYSFTEAVIRRIKRLLRLHTGS